MANLVKFLKGTSTGFTAITTKDSNTFYYLIDTNELYLGDNLIGSSSTLETIKESVGTLTELKTGNKDDLVKAINEVYDRLVEEEKASKVTVEKDDSGLIYTFRQGEASESDATSNIIGVVNIPQSLIVKNSETVTNPTGYPEGTYLKIDFTTFTGDKTVYLNIADMFDPYTTEENATEVQLSISEGNVISATVTNGAITMDKLAQEVKDNLGGASELEWGTF